MNEVVRGKIEKSGSIRFSLAAASRLTLARGMSFDFLGLETFCLYPDSSGRGSIFKKGQSYCASTKKIFDMNKVSYETGDVEVEFDLSSSWDCNGGRAYNVRFIPASSVRSYMQQEESLFDVEKPSPSLLGPDRGDNIQKEAEAKESHSEQLCFDFAPEIRTFIDKEGSLRFAPQIAKKLGLDRRIDDGKVYVSVFFNRSSHEFFPIELTVHSKPVPGSYPVFKKGKICCIQLGSVLSYYGHTNFRNSKFFLRLDDKSQKQFNGHRVYRFEVEEVAERETK